MMTKIPLWKILLKMFKTVTPDREAALMLLKDYVKEIISRLSPREQKILEMRFGLVDAWLTPWKR